MQYLVILGLLCLAVAVLSEDISLHGYCIDQGRQCRKNGRNECCRNLDCKKAKYGRKFTCQRRSGIERCAKKNERCERSRDCCRNRQCRQRRQWRTCQ